MRILIPNIKIEFQHSKQALEQLIRKKLMVPATDITDISIYKRSVDARKKPDIFFVYTIIVTTSVPIDQKKLDKIGATLFEPQNYVFPFKEKQLNVRPIVVGTGPAGLFCALLLARQGARPIVVERGEKAAERAKTIEAFQKTGVLKGHSNIQFGEGGAGTFSDGKLNTGVKDTFGRKQFILETLVKHGADPSILVSNKPHVGTDYLVRIVENMRKEILDLGGDVYFNTYVKDFLISEEKESITNQFSRKIEGILCEQEGKDITYKSEHVVLAIGHSARDTFRRLYDCTIPMESKPFAIGLRVEHPQTWINRSQYGDVHYRDPRLPVADYKLTYQSTSGRGVYSFCMCPGGYVVNASSTPGELVCNGMSLFSRDSMNANSALIVTVTPDDFIQEFEHESIEGDVFDAKHPLLGMLFQEKYEKKAYELTRHNALPTQHFDKFYASLQGRDYQWDHKETKDLYELEDIQSTCQSQLMEAPLEQCLPSYVSQCILEGMLAFGQQIYGFDHPKVRLIGIETRTSSPIKILRNEQMMSTVRGLYPCGEGAGYAGGIMSAAIDGIKVAEKIFENNESLECHW